MKASKLELWWWLIFSHKKFDQWVKVNENIVRENTSQKLEKQFEDKLMFLTMEDERNSMLASGLEYPILQVPIYNPHFKPYNRDTFCADRLSIKVDTYNKRELMFPISFCDERSSVENFKSQASSQLSKDLISKGLLKSRFWRNGSETVVEFYVNVYQK